MATRELPRPFQRENERRSYRPAQPPAIPPVESASSPPPPTAASRLTTVSANMPLRAMVPVTLAAAVLAFGAVYAVSDSQPTNAASPPAAQSQTELVASAGDEAAAGHDMVAKPYDPVTTAVKPGPKTFDLVATEVRMKVGSEVYDMWTFNNTVPGPVLRVVEGDKVTINIRNEGKSTFAHSVDFHSSRLTLGGGHVQVGPGKEGSFEFTAEYPGVFMYHCATPPVLEHIGRGMYGMMIVEPKEGFGRKMPEFAFVQSELYTGFQEMQDGAPSKIVFNGIPNQYVNEPIHLKPDQNVRLFVLNAGPSELSSLHVVGTVFDRVLEDGNPANLTVGRQALAMPASGGAVFEAKLVGEGRFPMVTHQFDHATKGAVAMLSTEPKGSSANMAH